MATTTCAVLADPDTMWSFCPNMSAAVIFAVLFAVVAGMHVFQAIHYRKPYSWVIIMSALWQFLTYVFRIASIKQPTSFGMYAAWFVLILVAPLWTNAFVYMVFGRMIWNYTYDQCVWRLSATKFGVVFVILDIIAFIIQVYGASSATGNDLTTDQVYQALHIYMGGVAAQLIFILICAAFGIKLFFMVKNGIVTDSKRRLVELLLYTQFATFFLIILRIIFRLIEYSSGIDSTIPNHEVYQYTLDTLPMFIALVLYNVVHPGRVMSGAETDMPSFLNRLKSCGRRK